MGKHRKWREDEMGEHQNREIYQSLGAIRMTADGR
jgi:hypothetical protein